MRDASELVGQPRSSPSAPTAAIAQTPAASGQSANGDEASTKPPSAGPTVPASPHESECTAK